MTIKVKNISKSFVSHSPLHLAKQYTHALNDISLEIHQGEILALIGESNSGKTTLAHCILRLTDLDSGQIIIDNQDITKYKDKQLLPFRKKMQMIFQDTCNSLNPRMTIKEIIGEALWEHKIVESQKILQHKINTIASYCGIDISILDYFPHECSIEQKKLVNIARALALEPSLLICDDILSTADISTKAKIIQLLIAYNKEFNLSYLFISNDMKVVQFLAHRVAVIYSGQIIETATKEVLLSNPKHPYTASLLQSSFIHSTSLDGESPSNTTVPTGCAFASRCPRASIICYQKKPPQTQNGEHIYSCFNPL